MAGHPDHAKLVYNVLLFWVSRRMSIFLQRIKLALTPSSHSRRATNTRVLRPRSGQLKKTTKTGDAPIKTLPRATSKSDSVINTSTCVRPRKLRSRSRQQKKSKTNDTCEKTLPTAISKSYSGITRHLKASPVCRKRFRVLDKARKSCHLSFLEAVFISGLSPVLCAQKEFVRSLSLF